MTGEKVGGAGVIPGLSSDAGGIRNDDIFAEAARKEIGVGVIGTPFVSDTIDCASVIANIADEFRDGVLSSDFFRR